jgi:hypothetical protein
MTLIDEIQRIFAVVVISSVVGIHPVKPHGQRVVKLFRVCSKDIILYPVKSAKNTFWCLTVSLAGTRNRTSPVPKKSGV